VNAGTVLNGGIPSRSTVCATVNPIGGGADDYSNIQNAINSCPAGQVVQLGAGAFTVELADLPIHIGTGISLRGTGSCAGSSSPYCSSSITVANGALPYTGGTCGINTSNQVACPNGGQAVILMSPTNPDYNYSWAQCSNAGSNIGTGCGAITLTADASQGQTTVQVSSTSGFSVGQWVLIDEASGAGWVTDPMNAFTGYGSVWAASDWLNSSGNPATGRVQWSKAMNVNWDFSSSQYPYQAGTPGCWHSYCDRPTAEIHKIASIGTGTLTFDDPLTVAFRQSGGHNAQVYPGPYPNQSGTGSPGMLQAAGVENLSVLRAATGGIEMSLCAYCWIKNVEVGNWYGGGISIEYSVRSELNTVYVHHCWDSVNNGGEYPIALDDASTEILVTNSITNYGGKGMVARAGGAGSVISYNYMDDTMYDSRSGIGDYWVDMEVNASHYSGPHHVLFEGNWGNNLDSDNTHGNAVYITFFRNNGTALRTPFDDPSNNNDAVNDSTGVGYACGTTGPSGCSPNAPGALRAAGPMTYNYWFAFVGNVLGVAGETTAANGWTYQGDWTGHRIFMLGWNTGNGGQDPYLSGVSGSYIFRHGNYDYVTNSTQWDPNTPDHTLPNSFYLSSSPAFFGNYQWPWVDPATGTTYSLPAKARYDAGTPLCSLCVEAVATHDFNGDGKSDIVWRDTSGDVAIWLMNGAQVLQAGGVGTAPVAVWSIVGQRDFNGNGMADLLWRDTSGDVAIWFMNGTQVTQSAGVGNVPLAWSVFGTGDFNGDGMGDILWQNTATGDLAIWLMNGAQVTQAAGIGNAPPGVWKIVGTGDFNGDGMTDILWQDTSGDVAIWFMNGTQVTEAVGVGNASPSVWKIVGTGDFNGDGMTDILWQDTSGDVAIWLMNGAQVTQTAGVGSAPPSVWSIVETGDFNGDGKSDILWQDTSGDVSIWFMNGTQVAQTGGAGNIPRSVWTIQNANAE
jgi:hypothetical protein